jgi:hypothetical protein
VAALPHMRSVLASIPSSFPALSDAIAWSISSGRIRNSESAAVSIPPQLVKSGSKFVWRKQQSPISPPLPCALFLLRFASLCTYHVLLNPIRASGTDLAASEQHWQSWLTRNMSFTA